MLLAHELLGRHDAPAVVLVHGITEDHRSWHPLLRSLSDHHRVLTVDLRGHGDSELCDPYDPMSYAGDVVETIAALGITDPLLVGHSLGGVVVSACAALAPCAGVVNIDQPLRLSAFKQGLTQLEPLLKGTEDEFRSAIDLLFANMYGPLPEHEVARLEGIRTPRQSVVLGTWAAVFDSTVEELDATVDALASAVTVPYLALHGDDPGPGYGEWLTSVVAGAVLEVWPGHGHYPHLVDPARFLARLAEFEATVRG